QHKAYWHWQVPAYILTKDIAAGVFMLLALGVGLGPRIFGEYAGPNGGSTFVLLSLALFFTAATTALLVFDLEKPTRFLSILYRPQWRSWLARGAFLLIAFTVVLGITWTLSLAKIVGFDVPSSWQRVWLLLGSPLALLASVYTALLL